MRVGLLYNKNEGWQKDGKHTQSAATFDEKKTVTFATPVTYRYIRIVPLTCKRYCATRMGFLV